MNKKIISRNPIPLIAIPTLTEQVLKWQIWLQLPIR